MKQFTAVKSRHISVEYTNESRAKNPGDVTIIPSTKGAIRSVILSANFFAKRATREISGNKLKATHINPFLLQL